jgi:hypothetical protein
MKKLNQSDANSLYLLLQPSYQQVRLQFGRQVGIELERLVRMITEDSLEQGVVIEESRQFCMQKELSQVLQKGNLLGSCSEQYEPLKPVKLQHCFRALTAHQ